MSETQIIGWAVLIGIYFLFKIKKIFKSKKIYRTENTSSKKILKLLEFDYIDSDGNKSKRKVQVIQYEPNGSKGIIYGRCFHRKQNRSFRIDRMKNITDQETGEIIYDIKNFLDTTADTA